MALASQPRTRALTLALLLAVAGTVLATWRIQPASGTQVTDEILYNPQTSGTPVLLGKRDLASTGSTSAILYLDGFGKPWVLLRDAASGASSHVRLPVSGGEAWASLSAALMPSGELWVLAGTGPLELRGYRLSGSPLPTSAALISASAIGDADSRPDDLLALASGGLVAVWHQQGSLGAQGLGVTYRPPGIDLLYTLYPLRFMPTFASKFVAAQHPDDQTVWIFGNADSWGAIGAVRLSEWSTHLQVDWTNANFISSTDGLFNADPENPDLEASVDPASGRIVLAYQSAARKILSTTPVVTGAYPVVAEISAGGSTSFSSLDEYVERVSSLGLSVQGNARWLAYRPIQADLSFDRLYLARTASGAWESPIELGRLYSPYERVLSGPSSEFVARLADGQIHMFRVIGGGDPLPTTSPSPGEPSPTPTESASPAPDASPTPTETAAPAPSPTPTSAPTPPSNCKTAKSKRCR
jgi:hypothetical protein